MRSVPSQVGIQAEIRDGRAKDALKKYQELAPNAKLRKVATPFSEDIDPDPGTGHAKPVKDPAETVATEQGELRHCAASILMKVLYAARMCRYDLLHVIGKLAC